MRGGGQIYEYTRGVRVADYLLHHHPNGVLVGLLVWASGSFQGIFRAALSWQFYFHANTFDHHSKWLGN